MFELCYCCCKPAARLNIAAYIRENVHQVRSIKAIFIPDEGRRWWLKR